MLPSSANSFSEYCAALEKLVQDPIGGWITTDGALFLTHRRAADHQRDLDRIVRARGAVSNAQSAQSSQYGQIQVQESTTTTTTTTEADNSKQAMADAQAAMMVEKREAVVNHFIEQAAENGTPEAEVIKIRDNIYAGRADALVQQQWDLIKSGKTARARAPQSQPAQQYTQPQIACQQQGYQGYPQMATPAAQPMQYQQTSPPAAQNIAYAQQGYQGYQQVTPPVQQAAAYPQQPYQGYQHQMTGRTPQACTYPQQPSTTNSKQKEKAASPPAQQYPHYQQFPQQGQQGSTAMQTYQQQAAPTASNQTAAQQGNQYGGYMVQQTTTTTISSAPGAGQQHQGQAARTAYTQQRPAWQQLPAAFQQLQLTQGPHDPGVMAQSNQQMIMQPAQQYAGAMQQQPQPQPQMAYTAQQQQSSAPAQQQHSPQAQIGHVSLSQQQHPPSAQMGYISPGQQHVASTQPSQISALTPQHGGYPQHSQQYLPEPGSSSVAVASTSKAGKHGKSGKGKGDKKEEKEKKSKK